MARGNPDYFTKTMGESERGYPISPAVIPHIWLKDDFESPNLKWYRNQGTVTLTTKTGFDNTDSEVITGDCSLRITSPVGNPIQVRFDYAPPVIQGKVGFAYKFYVFDYTHLESDFEHSRFMQFLIRSGDWRYDAMIVYYPDTYKWYLSEDAGTTWINFLTFRLRSTSYSTLKLVVDFTTAKYDKFFIDGTEVDISAYSLNKEANATGMIGRFFIDIQGTGGEQADMLIDDFTITTFEP